MKIDEALRKEAEVIEKNRDSVPAFKKDDLSNIIICAAFSDGRMHCILPANKQTTIDMLEALLKDLKGSGSHITHKVKDEKGDESGGLWSDII